MGQYYVIANLDKRETLRPCRHNCGAKLMEFGYTECELVRKFCHLMANEWKGDRVIVCGDYIRDVYGIPNSDTFSLVLERWSYELGVPLSYFYDFIHDFDEPKIAKAKTYRYVVNDNTKEFIDIEKCPTEYYYIDKKRKAHANKISPLVMLLAAGNGLGSGDFRGDCRLVGKWIPDSKSVYTTNDIPDGYTEIMPYFTEHKSQGDAGVEFMNYLIKEIDSLKKGE